MIPIIAASLVGNVLNQVVGALAPSPSSAPPFQPYLDQVQAADKTASQTSVAAAPSGIMHADQWNQMSSQDVKSWSQGLVGRHVDATDASGRTISGVVTNVRLTGGNTALEIGGHLVSLSQLNQITWAPSVA